MHQDCWEGPARQMAYEKRKVKAMALRVITGASPKLPCSVMTSQLDLTSAAITFDHVRFRYSAGGEGGAGVSTEGLVQHLNGEGGRGGAQRS